MEFIYKDGVPWDDEIIKDKDYNPLAAAAMIEYAETFGSPAGTCLTSWQTVNGILSKGFTMTKPKREKTIEALVRTGMFVRTEEGLLGKTDHRKDRQSNLSGFSDNNRFLCLPPEWLNYCWETFGKDCMAAKTLFLFYKTGKWMENDGPKEYRVGITGRGGFLKRFGYNEGSGAGKEKMTKILDRLKEDGVIILSSPQIVKTEWGFSGTYRYFYGINEKIPSEKNTSVLVSFAAESWEKLSMELADKGIEYREI